MGTHHACHSDRPNLPGEQDFRDSGGSTSVRWRPQLDPRQSPHTNGTFQHKPTTGEDYRSATRPPMNPYYGSRDTRNELAHLDPRRYTAHVPPHTRQPQEVDVEYTRMMKPVFPKGDRPCHPAIGIGANLPTPMGIAPWMPRLLRVGNIMVINGGTILSLQRSS